MINMLIVDDEIIIQKGLAKVPWDTVGVHLIKTVSSGAEALKLIKTENIQILFTDIQMPDINGLELLKAAKLLNPEIEGVILTGHSSFTYAKEAVSLQAYDYILKPCNPREVLDIIGKLACRIENRIQKQTLFSHTIYRLQENELMNNLLHFIVDTPVSPNIGEHSFHFPDYLKSSCWFQTGLCSLNEAVPNNIIVSFKASGYDMIALEYNSKKIFLFYSEKNTPVPTEEIKKFFYALKSSFPFENLRLSLGGQVSSLIELPLSFRQAEQVFSLFFSHPQENFLTYGSLQDKLSTKAPESITRELIFHIESCNYTAAAEGLKKLEDYYETAYVLPGYIHAVFIELSIFACNLASQKKEENFSGLTAEQLLMITDSKSLDELISITKSLIFRCIDILNSSCDLPPSNLAQQCRDYIKENYDKEINLAKAAQTLHVNADYLGRLLKKEFGLSFGQILANIRLEKACSLLADINLPISEISLTVGFKDFRHFGQMFKARYKMTPSQYRKTLINRNT